MVKRVPKPEPTELSAGVAVLLGAYGTVMPSEWLVGRVLWVGDDEVVVERSDMTGSNRWRELYPRSDIRAFGSIDDLVAFRAKAEKAIEDRRTVVRDLRQQLDKAIRSVWQALDEVGASGERRRG